MKKVHRILKLCSNFRVIVVINCLIFLLNIVVFSHNYHYSKVTVVSIDDNCPVQIASSTAPVNNDHIVEYPYNWLTQEAAAFASLMVASDRQLLGRTFRVFVETVEAAKLSYFLISGTLIGSLRHHGPIPWDDDVDVMFNASDMSKLTKVLSKLRPDYGLYKKNPSDRVFLWKLFPIEGRELKSFPDYRTPFIDIWFYYENRTHIWDAALGWKKYNTWPKRYIFPLRRRPYGELLLPAPCNGLFAVSTHTNISMCRSPYYNHILEMGIPNSIKISCERLFNFYPFVRRTTLANGSSHLVKETLMMGNRTIREVIVDQFC